MPGSAGDRTHEAPYLLQALTTEHFALQTARAATVAAAKGRASLYMSAVAAAVIATAFIGEATPAGISL